MKSLELANSLKGNTWLLGDFNYSKFSWDQEHVPSIKSGCGLHTHYEDFVDFLDDFSLVQMVTEPTRGDNILDYFLTTNPTLVNNI